ncbi:MAG: helix-turn-helix transcriptional regulator [Planctomycetes bacterium]|nr:helix-turn-helix transcriptional regulator [Planctomycetota bacterium]
MIHLGKTARYLRKRKGFTQRKTAGLLQISEVHLSNIENNKAAPSGDLLKRYRELWNVDLYVLAWCLHGNLDKLPKQIRRSAEKLAEAWQSELTQSDVLTPKQIKSKCSTYDK